MQRRSTARDGHPRRLSTVPLCQVSEKWAHAQQETASSLSRLWPAVRPVLRAISHSGGHADTHRTLARGADGIRWHVSRCRGATQGAPGFAGLVHGVSASSPLRPACHLPRHRHAATPGGGSGCNEQLRAEASTHAVALDRHGRHHPPGDGPCTSGDTADAVRSACGRRGLARIVSTPHATPISMWSTRA
jgi:hypothetical protein